MKQLSAKTTVCPAYLLLLQMPRQGEIAPMPVAKTLMSIVFAAQIAGLVLSGVLTQHMGVRRVFALCALMLVVLMLWANFGWNPGRRPLMSMFFAKTVFFSGVVSG